MVVEAWDLAVWEPVDEAASRKSSEYKKGWRSASLFSRKHLFC